MLLISFVTVLYGYIMVISVLCVYIVINNVLYVYIIINHVLYVYTIVVTIKLNVPQPQRCWEMLMHVPLIAVVICRMGASWEEGDGAVDSLSAAIQYEVGRPPSLLSP